MKIFFLVLFVSAFLQSAFLPINLVLVILIARSIVFPEKGNLIMAFFGGLLLSFLTQDNLGYWPILLLLVIKLGHVFKSLPISFNPFIIFIAGSLIIFLTSLVNSFFIKEQLVFWPHSIEALLVLPAYYLIKLWEERFIAKSVIKLKVSGK